MQRTFSARARWSAGCCPSTASREHPAYAEVPIERPIFVCGLPRTGTTALHRLLNADPAHQGLELWLTEVPAAAAAARDLGARTRSTPR